jgi:hypothetical protein
LWFFNQNTSTLLYSCVFFNFTIILTIFLFIYHILNFSYAWQLLKLFFLIFEFIIKIVLWPIIINKGIICRNNFRFKIVFIYKNIFIVIFLVWIIISVKFILASNASISLWIRGLLWIRYWVILYLLSRFFILIVGNSLFFKRFKKLIDLVIVF